MSKNVVTTTPDETGTAWPVPNIALKRQDRTLRSWKPTVHYQLTETSVSRHPSESLSSPSVRSSQEQILHEPEFPDSDNLVLDNDVFLPQIAEPDLQLIVPPNTPSMAEERTLLPDQFSGAPKENASEFWRRF